MEHTGLQVGLIQRNGSEIAELKEYMPMLFQRFIHT